MIDREKVIDELKGMVKVCAMYGDDEAIETLNSSISMLKEQEPRVMSLEELNLDADESVICYSEFCDSRVVNVTAPFCYPGDRLVQLPYIGTEYKNWVDPEQYGILWRCWTSRPTEELRKNTPWEEDNA